MASSAGKAIASTVTVTVEGLEVVPPKVIVAGVGDDCPSAGLPEVLIVMLQGFTVVCEPTESPAACMAVVTEVQVKMHDPKLTCAVSVWSPTTSVAVGVDAEVLVKVSSTCCPW